MPVFLSVGKASVVVGGQFGSEAKGLVAGYIAGLARHQIAKGAIFCTTNAGAQAGHTTILPDGTKFVCYHLPTAGVLIPDSWIYLNAGAIIDLELLGREVDDVSRALGVPAKSIWDRMTVHPHATVITDEARSIEKYGATQHLGSTQKGVGAALASKIMRYPDAVFNEHKYPGPATEEIDLDGHTVLIEIPQGTGLSLNSSGFYPKVTSRECWVGQGMVDAGLHPSKLGVVSMVVRTMPIRVGHIYGDNNEIVGNSGPFYSDSRELTWDEVGVEPERTTVTQRVRRIATWSRKQYKHALKLNRPDNVFLTFTNYLTRAELKDLVITMREDEINARLRVNHYFSWGPRTDQISAIYLDAHANCKDA